MGKCMLWAAMCASEEQPAWRRIKEAIDQIEKDLRTSPTEKYR
jgi:hypothetical protein